MELIEPIEIVLDRPRKLLINHKALRRAESEVNKMRFAHPNDYASIDSLMVAGFNAIFRISGMLPRDLLVCMLWAGLANEDPKLTIDRIDELMDQTPLDLGTISGIVWGAYFRAAGKNLQIVGAGSAEDEKKTNAAGRPTGSDSGAPRDLN